MDLGGAPLYLRAADQFWASMFEWKEVIVEKWKIMTHIFQGKWTFETADSGVLIHHVCQDKSNLLVSKRVHGNDFKIASGIQRPVLLLKVLAVIQAIQNPGPYGQTSQSMYLDHQVIGRP
jgi:hypothetical protein